MAKNNNVRVRLGERSYDILVQPDLLTKTGEEIAARVCGGDPAGRLAVVLTNPKVELYHGAAVYQSLEDAGFRVLKVVLPAGEVYKSLQTVKRVYKMMLQEKADRRAVVIALGGGVIGDMAGFVAATYNRGLDFVQIPTTLLAQVDSSVGGKTGVNLDAGKNLIGAFYQPKLVLIDPTTLRSLPLRERRSGLAEIVKYGLISDRKFFDLLVKEGPAMLRLSSGQLDHAISRSCQIKARVVEQDEREDGLRAILNYGHTVGHALEAITHYRVYRHGEAIAIGMVSAALIGEELGRTGSDVTESILDVFSSMGFGQLYLDERITIAAVLRTMAWDKKSVDGAARFVLLDEIGKATPGHPVPEAVIRKALERQRTL